MPWPNRSWTPPFASTPPWDQGYWNRQPASDPTASDLFAIGRQAAGSLDQLQHGTDQGRHQAYRQWAERRVSRQAAKKTTKSIRATALVFFASLRLRETLFVGP